MSSTIDDLKPERDAVDEALSALEVFTVIRVETLPATEEPSRRVCLEQVRAADSMVLLLASRYGFVPEASNPSKLSVTHLEYREARRLKRPVFAFIRDLAEREPGLESFIGEVSHFDDGVHRKKWQSPEDLKREVRRSLLFFIARRARSQRSRTAISGASTQLADFPDLAEFRLAFTVAEGLVDWRTDLLTLLREQCRQEVLPTPSLVEDQTETEGRSLIGVNSILGASADHVHLHITAKDFSGESATPRPIVLDVPRTHAGAKLVAAAIVGLLFLIAEDLPRGISRLIDAAEDSRASPRSSASLLGAAAFAGASAGGEGSHRIARRLLKLGHLDDATVSEAVLCLTAAELRYEQVGARLALWETKRLALLLLLAALDGPDRNSEHLYNLARQALRHHPRLALRFYSELLVVDPTYDARWYLHRDMGLISYHAGRYNGAALSYDRACRLKAHDSELWRFAGDAFYYAGNWAQALLRYEKAVTIEPIEDCFLDFKLAFARSKLAAGVSETKAFPARRGLSRRLSAVGSAAAAAGAARVAKPVFRAAKIACDLNPDADNWLALYANKRGTYPEAIAHLRLALAAVPEDPSPRLNLAVNLIFKEGVFGEEARAHARIAAFHAGPASLDQFRLRLVNTPNREQHCLVFEEILRSVKADFEAWQERRQKVLAPERFEDSLHLEFRP